MPTELEELVEFLHHANTQIRQIATENLVPYSIAQPLIFKSRRLQPVKDLKLLVWDYPPIAQNALTILINISSDVSVLEELAGDDTFLETILNRVTNTNEPHADDLCSLLANLSKASSFARLIPLERAQIPSLTPSKRAIIQLLELFNKGAHGGWNKGATYDDLAYLFTDLSKYPALITFLTAPTPHSPLDPLTTFLPHTTSASHTRRFGIAALLKNTAMLHPDIPYLLQPAHSILPPLLLPLCSSDQEGISEEEMETLPEECQFLMGSEHKQEEDLEIVKIHLETLYLLVTRGGREGRTIVKAKGAYPVVRELHLQFEDEEVRRGCERLVDVLMGEEEAVEINAQGKRAVEGQAEEEREEEGEEADDAIVPIF